MQPWPNAAISPRVIGAVLRDRLATWLTPALAITALAAAYAAIKPDAWVASQRMIVRNEASGADHGPGRFVQPSDMKTAQETIAELAKGRAVLQAALAEAGGPEGAGPDWRPSDADVANLAGGVGIAAPKGVEFGATEIFYVKVRAESRERAEKLVAAVCRQLQSRFQSLREDRALSMMAELERSAALARADLQAAVEPLARLEREVGGDLAELRMLLESSSADSDLRRGAVEIENELRQASVAERNQADQVALLKHVVADARGLLAIPGRLLDAQPALKRLKEALVDAQLKTARLGGNLTSDHPQYKATFAEQERIENDLRQEITLALRGAEVDLRLASERVHTLESQLAQLRARLDKLAGLRAEYAAMTAAATHRTELLQSAEQALSDARSIHAGAGAASLIDLVDSPDAGGGPIGPGRASIVAAGAIAGVVFGWAVLFLTYRPSEMDRRLAQLAALRQRAAHGENTGNGDGYGYAQHPFDRGLFLRDGDRRFWNR